MNDRFKFRVVRGKNPFTPAGTVLYFALGDEVGFGQGDVVEQCTGLKDKNGKLIYESDLIKTANYKTGLPEIYVVKWCDECGLYQLESTQSDQIIDMYRAEKGIICGNIHEQAEQKE